MTKQWIGVGLGAVLGAAIAGAGLVMLSKQPEKRERPAKNNSERPKREVTLPDGAAVEFLLLEPLHSGGADVGDTAKIVVTKDVKRDSVTVVPAGTIGEIEVVRSREGSVMSSLVNQPARLEVKFRPLELDGGSVALDAQIDGAVTLELTRKTSSKDEASAALKRLWENEQTQDVLNRLAQRLNGESSDDLDDPTSRKILVDVADQLGLTATTKAVNGNAKSVGGLLLATEKASRGQFSDMNAADAMIALQAVTELAHIANGVDRGLRGKIKGRNINIPIGTRMTAYTAKPVTVLR